MNREELAARKKKVARLARQATGIIYDHGSQAERCRRAFAALAEGARQYEDVPEIMEIIELSERAVMSFGLEAGQWTALCGEVEKKLRMLGWSMESIEGGAIVTVTANHAGHYIHFYALEEGRILAFEEDGTEIELRDLEEPRTIRNTIDELEQSHIRCR